MSGAEEEQGAVEAEQPTTDPIDQAAATFAKLGFEGAVVELAKNFKPHEYDRVRISLAKRLGVRTPTLDRAYDRATADDKNGKSGNGQGPVFTLEDPELWQEPVDGAPLSRRSPTPSRVTYLCRRERHL